MWLCDLLNSTIFQTVISGVLVFILGQLFIEYFLRPLQRYVQLRAKIAYYLVFYGNRFDLNTKISGGTSEELRKLAAEIVAYSIEKPVILFYVRRKKLKEISTRFIGLSNSVSNEPDFDFINENVDKIKKNINLS